MLKGITKLSQKSVLQSYRYNHHKNLSTVVDERKYVAIVGSGPSAFYAAKTLLDASPTMHVDIWERLPAPFGLVRYGVAPDHQEVKAVALQFAELFEKRQDRMRMFANVFIGDEKSASAISCQSSGRQSINSPKSTAGIVPLNVLQQAYPSGVILAYGASSDRRLPIAGADLPGVFSARSFVGWYNGHPDCRHLHAPLSTSSTETIHDKEHFDLRTIKNVVIVGHGNVALDCARILARPAEVFESTDVSLEALGALYQSSVERISLLGRRGSAQSAFTIKELRELSRAPSVNLSILQEELLAGNTDATKQELEGNRPKKRIGDLMETIATTTATRNEAKAAGEEVLGRNVDIRFLMAPVSYEPNPETGRIGSVRVAKMRLEGEAGKQKAVPTGEEDVLPADLVLESIGYRSMPISTELPWNPSSSTALHSEGRVLKDGNIPVPGLYVTGWLKRGPSGIVGTNIGCAKETATSLLVDLQQSAPVTNEDPVNVLLNAGCNDALKRSLDWNAVSRLLSAEESAGQSSSPAKPRVKQTNPIHMVEIARGER